MMWYYENSRSMSDATETAIWSFPGISHTFILHNVSCQKVNMYLALGHIHVHV